MVDNYRIFGLVGSLHNNPPTLMYTSTLYSVKDGKIILLWRSTSKVSDSNGKSYRWCHWEEVVHLWDRKIQLQFYHVFPPHSGSKRTGRKFGTHGKSRCYGDISCTSCTDRFCGFLACGRPPILLSSSFSQTRKAATAANTMNCCIQRL